MNPAKRQSATLFVVDDDPAGRESLCDLLTSQGFACAPFATAEEFLAAYDDEQFGCLITDFKMPGLSGVELQAKLAARGSPLPVIVVSGFADVPLAVRAMQQGAVTLLQKPFDRGELLAAVDAALALAGERRRAQSQENLVAARVARLTDEEERVMQRLVAGQPNKMIAKELDIGLRTVERRRQQILEKMEVGSLPELAALLAQHRQS